MKPIAVIHWEDDYGDHTTDIYTQRQLQTEMRWIHSRKYLSWTCMCDTTVRIPRIRA